MNADSKDVDVFCIYFTYIYFVNFEWLNIVWKRLTMILISAFGQQQQQPSTSVFGQPATTQSAFGCK